MIKKGTYVILKDPFWYEGQNYGDTLGTVIDTNSYLIVEIQNREKIKVKCLQYEVEILADNTLEDDDSETLFEDWP